MTPLQSFYADAFFRLSSLGWLGGLDLLLVTIAFYLLLNLVRRTRAAFLLRGILVLGVVLFIITILLPLPTFDWVVQGLLIAMLVATPIIFQPELRRLLERVGRSAGVSLTVRETATESVLTSLVRAVERLAADQTGALIALEGHASLQEITETGVPINGQVTSELLQAIFYSENPLHDGAVVLREDRLVAAGCLLPLTERPLYFKRRLGTRHRAAVGLSETSDALVIVVSEETGHISVARDGQLQRPLDIPALRERLLHFYAPSNSNTPGPSLWRLVREAVQYLQRPPAQMDLRQMLPNIGLWAAALLLALVAWALVIEQTDPAQRELIEDIPLRVLNLPPNLTPVEPLPNFVSAIIQTTASARRTLSPASFQATVSLGDLGSGLHNVPIRINASADEVRVLETVPPVLDIELAPEVSRFFTVTVELTNQDNLSPAYQLVGLPVVVPGQVEVIGPEPLVEQVTQVQTSISLANATGSLRELRPVQALDAEGDVVAGVRLEPSQAQVSVAVRRRLNAVDVGVRAIIEGSPTLGYWLSGVNVSPASVTLQGDPEQLAQLGSFVDTLPVDIDNAAGDLRVQIPLDLPAEVQAFDSEGNIANTVTVVAEIEARTGDLVITRPVELLTGGRDVAVSPRRVDLLLSGPLPVLNEIEANPELVQVVVNTADLPSGQNVEVRPTVVTPPNVQAQVVPTSVLVTVP